MTVIEDHLNLVSKLSAVKVANAGKVLASYYRSRLTSTPSHQGLPISISIEPTTSCNLRCPECPSGLRAFTRPTGMLATDLHERIINELKDTLLYLTFYFQGEPYLNPRFLAMVKYASERGIYTATSTNAHYLDYENAKATIASGLDRLIISIDGTSQDTYEAYRVGGNLERVIGGTENILRARKELKSKTPHVVFQFLVVRPNEHEIPAVRKLARKVGVDRVLLKTAQINNFKYGSDLIPSMEKYSRYRKEKDGTYSIKNDLPDHCWKMWHSCVVTWDGKVVPCCFDKDGHYILGELSATSFSEIWCSEAYRRFRASLLRSRSEIEICKNCSEGTQVWA